MNPARKNVVFSIDRITLDSGDILESHTVSDEDSWSALMQVTRTFHDPDVADYFGVYGFTCGDLRIQDQDDRHFWRVSMEPE